MLVYSCKEVPAKLPILGNADIVYLQKNGATIADTVYPKIPAFSFLNEDSILVSNDNFKNKIWIVEFFFATCPTICPIMQKQLKNVVKATQGFENNIEFISFTIDPTHDSPSKLKAYKKQNKILNKKEFELINNHLNNLNLPRNINKFFSLKNLNTLLSFMKKDKKNNTKKISLVLLKRIGSPVYKLQFNEKTINLFLKKELTK